MKKRLLKVFKDNGIFLSATDWDSELEVDSVTFLSILVGIEDEFQVELAFWENETNYTPTISLKKCEKMLIKVNEE